MVAHDVTDPDIGRLDDLPPARERVRQVLEQSIIRGQFAPGQRLFEKSLSEQLGVSRGPVREALQALHRDKWVDVRSNHGAYVHQPTPKEIRDFFTVREALEVQAARLAAQHATAEDLAELSAVLAEGDAAIASGDEHALVTANSAFHRCVARCADNTVLSELTGMMDKRLQWYFRDVAVPRAADSWREHRAFVAALERHDADEAAVVMRAHIAATAQMYDESGA